MMHMTNLKRDYKIFLDHKGGNAFDVATRDGNIVLGADDDYFIYFKNVNFRADGKIDARYLGVANDSMIDGYCRNVDIDADGFKVGGQLVKTARLVALNNKSGAIIIISND
jgi:hypothetical protein